MNSIRCLKANADSMLCSGDCRREIHCTSCGAPLSLVGRQRHRDSSQELRQAAARLWPASVPGRHLIANFFYKLKQYRGIATRYDKTARNFLGAIYLAAFVIWLN
jgi:predicted nuclease with RNAse H fold